MEVITFTISLPPVTKKNSQRVYRRGNSLLLLPSQAYEDYERFARWYLKGTGKKLDVPCEVKCLFYMKTRRRVDLTNLLEAIDDVLVKYKVLADDNSSIIVSHDGSRVLYDPENPRTEVTITPLEESQQ